MTAVAGHGCDAQRALPVGGTTPDSSAYGIKPKSRLIERAGRKERLAALVAELEAAGVQVESASYKVAMAGDYWNIWVRWGQGLLNITTTAGVRRHLETIAAHTAVDEGRVL